MAIARHHGPQQVQPHLGRLYRVLILHWPVIRSGYVQGLYWVLDEYKEVGLCVSRSTEVTKNTATGVGLCAQDAVTESLD